jgi:hypothetical protein
MKWSAAIKGNDKTFKALDYQANLCYEGLRRKTPCQENAPFAKENPSLEITSVTRTARQSAAFF